MTTHPFPDDDAATNWALQWLARRGFAVTRPNSTARMTCKELRDRHAPFLSLAAFHQRLGHPACPVFAAERGDSGRIITLAPTPALIAFLALPKLPGRSMGRREGKGNFNAEAAEAQRGEERIGSICLGDGGIEVSPPRRYLGADSAVAKPECTPGECNQGLPSAGPCDPGKLSQSHPDLCGSAASAF